MDIYVTIQDSMGWEDYHLHEFHIPVKGSKKLLEIGIPSEDDLTFGMVVLPGYEEKISDRFNMRRKRSVYVYDFGDGCDDRRSMYFFPGQTTRSNTMRRVVCQIYQV